MPNKFQSRSSELELMDGEITEKQELFVNLKELEYINTLTGGPALVFAALQKILVARSLQNNFENKPETVVHIADIGYGAGDMLVYLQENAHLLPCKIRLTGIDLMPEAAEYALEMHPELGNNVQFVTADYADWFAEGNQPDIVLASLFCHHLTDAQLIVFLENIRKNARIGAIINDLHRHFIAYYGIKALTALFSKSRFTKNDAPLSVLRGFVQQEWLVLLKKANISRFSLQWKWAFRYLLIIENH